MRWLVLCSLVLAGCAGGGTRAELLEAAKACGAGPECADKWAAWNKAEERKRAEITCPGDQVLYSTRHGEEGCISRQDVVDLLNSLQRGY